MEPTVATQFPAGRVVAILEQRVGVNRRPPAEFERAYLERLALYLRPGMVVYDVGAEQGEFTAFVAGFAGARNVHIFEPSPVMWPNIRTVWEANETEAPGGCWAGFVADRSRDAVVGTGWPGASSGNVHSESAFAVVHERPDIPAISLDEYAAFTGAPPDVIMCDVEGAEALVLEGARGLLAKRRPRVFLSLHNLGLIETYRYAHGGQCRQTDIFRLLGEVGYRTELISVDHEAHVLCLPAEDVA